MAEKKDELFKLASLDKLQPIQPFKMSLLNPKLVGYALQSVNLGSEFRTHTLIHAVKTYNIFQYRFNPQTTQEFLAE